MPDIEAPDNDVAEQQQGYEPVAAGSPSLDVETPEADAIEQQQHVAPVSGSTLSGLADGVPEADAIEQAQPVDFDEDDYR